MLNATHKQWLSPFTAVTFAAVSISGLFLLFHQKFAGMNTVHQWGGILFLLAGVLHAIMNWRVLLSYFSNTRAVLGALAGIATIALLIALFPHSEHGGSYHGKGYDARRGFYSTPHNR